MGPSEFLKKKIRLLRPLETDRGQNRSKKKRLKIAESDLYWCQKEARYLRSEMETDNTHMAQERVKRLREQVKEIDDRLESVEDSL